MPVGLMLKSMTAYELSEWLIYFKIKGFILEPKKNVGKKEPVSTGTVIRAMFHHRVIKKEK